MWLGISRRKQTIHDSMTPNCRCYYYYYWFVAKQFGRIIYIVRGVHPPCGNDAFPPFQISPLFPKILSDSLENLWPFFSHQLQIWNFPTYFHCFNTFSPYFGKIIVTSLWFRKIYVFFTYFVFFVPPLLLPWCIYASHNAHTGRPCILYLPFIWRVKMKT